ncbi:protein dopey-1 homolog isoform X1 [Chrysoperla carnea]|uniref:protein dopey-1 homolog isoform X1 n=1 Tax=Chrysoperla carnea TaxID=189513 RepID=UPI001D0954B4|nr:protein dopey-1 homolog isoform X1 [Chrysoperla carnea]
MMSTQTLEENELLIKDSKYRLYVSAVDKALKNFEYTTEWADLIAALGKLNKVLLSYTKYPVIPRRIKLSKRLAQCMHPALPAGVHLKALETYDVIFKCMGTNRLAQELFIYSAGLFPLLGYAATPVRPALLAVYEAHFVPLGERLLPALSGFLAGVLPGLEPGSDHYDSTNGLLERICESVGIQEFYAALWKCIQCDSPARAPAVAFALTHINKKTGQNSSAPFLQEENTVLMIGALESALQDNSVLVQRSALDLLIIVLPLHGTPSPSISLISAALHTVLRRDMSLNRRLYSWLLGSETTAQVLPLPVDDTKNDEIKNNATLDESNTYYKRYSHELVLKALVTIFRQSYQNQTIDIRPYRVLTSLLDKPEIATDILDRILFDVFRALYLTCKHQLNHEDCKEDGAGLFDTKFTDILQNQNKKLNRKNAILTKCQDLIKHANLLFNTLETYYIWEYIGDLFAKAACIPSTQIDVNKNVSDVGTGLPNVLELCSVTELLLDIIPIETYVNSSSEILPNLFTRIITLVNDNLSTLEAEDIVYALQLCTNILTKIQPVSIKTTTVAVKSSLNASFVNDLKKLDDSMEKSKSSNDLTTSNIAETPELAPIENFSLPNNHVDENHLKANLNLEKSKSDSKLNENDEKDERERSNSNQMLRRFQIRSPKFDKKAKNKKSKSSSKLFDYKNDVLPVEENEKTIILNPTNENTAKPEIENKYILKCLVLFKTFFTNLLQNKIFTTINLLSFYEKFLIKKNIEDECMKQLELLLTEDEKNKSMSQSSYDIVQLTNDFRITFAIGNYGEAIKAASIMLLEFSAFPNILDVDITETDLPLWLKYLTVITCLNYENSIDLQLVCMNTCLEIISLSKSMNQMNNANEKNTTVLMGILRPEYLGFIENSTSIIEIMAQTLWTFLSTISNHTQILTCITLLYHLHNIFENSNLVENVIGRYLVGNNCSMNALKCFVTLWHVGRDLEPKFILFKQNIQHFEKCLLKIIDNLQNTENISLKLFAENFVLHSLLRNDVSRLISPLFVMLLSPNTARISVLHANIEKSNHITNDDVQKFEDRSLKKIYAISSVDGHVMYHIADDKKKINQGKSFSFSKTNIHQSNEAVSLATSLVDDKNIVTQKNHDFKITESFLYNNSTKTSGMKVFVNPLSFKDSSNSDKSSIDSYSTSDGTSENIPEVDNLVNDEKSTISANDRDSGIIYETDFLNETNDDFELTNSLRKENKIDEIPNQLIDKNDDAQVKIINFSPSKKVSAYLEQIENISDGITHSGKRAKFVKSHSLDENNKKDEDDDSISESNLVHSWSYVTENVQHVDADLEISTPAEEFFQNGGTTQAVVEDVVSGIVDEVCKNEKKEEEKSVVGKSILKNKIITNKNHNTEPILINSVHSHLLLYRDVYDSNIVLYAIRTLKAIVNSNSKMLIGSLSTTALQTNSDIINLLARHRKSVYGYGFYGDSTEYINFYRGNMYLEVLISICLNYARSFYPNLTTKKLNNYEVDNNLKIQLECLDLLNIIVKELVGIVKESGKGFASYITDLLLKCKLQKVLLHSLVASVKSCDTDKKSFTDEILIFNNIVFKKSDKIVSENVESFQVQLLRLVQSLIALEYYVEIRGECGPITTVPQQAIFRAALLSALQSTALRPLHRTWTGMIAASLPYLGSSLTQIVLSVIHQLCSNIEVISKEYNTNKSLDPVKSIREAHRKTFKPEIMAMISSKSLSTDFNLTPVDILDSSFQFIKSNKIKKSGSNESQEQPLTDSSNFEIISDYAIMQLESLTALTHYCLLENSQCSSALTQTNTSTSHQFGFANPTHLINNLLNVFTSNPLIEDNTKSQTSENYQESKRAVLSHLPRIVTSVALLWQHVSIETCDNNGCAILGSRHILRKQLLEFLSPISLHHNTHFLAAIGVAWNERKPNIIKTVLPSPNDAQKSLVNLVSALRVIPIDNLVQTIHSVVKSPPVTEGLKSDVNLDLSVLELFYCYIQNVNKTQLMESWSSLLGLIKDGPTLNPSCQFIILAILNEFVQKCSPLNEKKDQKDLQDVTTKLIESISQISGSCLEQTTWLRRNLAVREGDMSNLPATPEISSVQTYSVQAQMILAEILAPLLDVCFGSAEKDKVISIISSLMNNVVPYLRKHSARNVSSWSACSNLLASLSGYPATRRAWRREALEVLLDPSLFKMPAECIAHWRNIVDHLMTHDNTTFRELMNRVSLGQSGGLSLFSSRDQEAEQRAMLLKRLAFVIICGDTDQYAKHMPEVQEQLAGGFRMGAPNVAGSVFLCCRALILRLTSLHITSLWPLILSECLQTLIRVENQLSGNNDLNSTNEGGWNVDALSSEGLKRTMGAVQLLDLALLIPSHDLPHFQMYKWAFIRTNDTSTVVGSNEFKSIFEPHLNRILELLDAKYGNCDIQLQPHSSGLYIFSSLEGTITVNDLHCLVKAMATRKYERHVKHSELISAVELDFLERIPLL